MRNDARVTIGDCLPSILANQRARHAEFVEQSKHLPDFCQDCTYRSRLHGQHAPCVNSSCPSHTAPAIGRTTPGIGPSSWQSTAYGDSESYARIVAERFGHDTYIDLLIVGNVHEAHDDATRERFIALAGENARIAFHYARMVTL